MADKNLLDLEDEDAKVENPRIKELSTKVKLTAQERDVEKELNKTLSSERDNAQREVNFYKEFSGVTSKYSNATQFTEAIKTKVLAGYTVEDATVSVLAKEGKLTTPPPERDTAAGGSSTTSIANGAKKEIRDMSQAEKLAELHEHEKDGRLSWS